MLKKKWKALNVVDLLARLGGKLPQVNGKGIPSQLKPMTFP